jgi:type I restriction enzyme R subunit
MLNDGDKGAILQRDRKTYGIAPHLPCGVITPATLRKIAEVAEKYNVPLIKVTSAARIALLGITEEQVDQEGKTTKEEVVFWDEEEREGQEELDNEPVLDKGVEVKEPQKRYGKKYYFDGGQVAISAHLVYELDPNGKQLRVVRYSEYAGETVRTLFPSTAALRERWKHAGEREEIIQLLADRGIDFDTLATSAGYPEADPFDLICHIAFNAPLRTRRERAEQLKHDKSDFFSRYGPEARGVLEDLIEKYAEHGTTQFVMPDILKVPPLSERGNVIEIARFFGGAEKLRHALHELQELLYAS